MNSVTAIVPMRHSSERVPGKNYRDFAGEPLYRRIVRSLLSCPSVGLVAIDTDSPVIREDAAEAFPSVRVLERPEHLRAGETPMNDVLLHTVEALGGEHFHQTHSTNPLLRPETIEKAIHAYFESENHDSLFTVTRWQTRFWTADGKPMNHDPNRLERTQDLPPIYEENSCLYLFSSETLRERKNRLGHRPQLFETDRLESMDIDEEADFLMAEVLYKQKGCEA